MFLLFSKEDNLVLKQALKNFNRVRFKLSLIAE